jgi:drug/metabolite transporter (DMT)-like permease
MTSIRAGVLLALLAATMFGATAPLIQRWGMDAGPFATAGLLYAGASVVALLSRKGSRREAPLRREHLPRLLLVAVSGAFLAPVALAWGLQRSSGTAASLMLNLEAVFTFGFALLFYREHAGSRVWAAAGLITAGAVLLTGSHSDAGTGSALGLAAVALATILWALDNTLSRPLSDLNPAAVVAAKGLLGTLLSVSLAWALGESMPSLGSAAGLLLCGATGYGWSLRFYLLAQRRLGAARTGSVFAAAPFVGAIIALSMGQPFGGNVAGLAAVLMGVGVYLHLTESHEHEHRHAAFEHVHAHTHNDAHHGHVHVPGVSGTHSHPHTHEEQVHRHSHASDSHHRHSH